MVKGDKDKDKGGEKSTVQDIKQKREKQVQEMKAQEKLRKDLQVQHFNEQQKEKREAEKRNRD